MFITNFEPRGNILLEKNRTAVGNDSSFKEKNIRIGYLFSYFY
jgi:hypothetical protein